MKWLACVLLGCYAAVAQLHRDPTLDRHWDLWKETYGKRYREEVGAVLVWAVCFYSSTLHFPPFKLYSCKQCLQQMLCSHFLQDSVLGVRDIAGNEWGSCFYGAYFLVRETGNK